MSQINTSRASINWAKQGKDEIDYLKEIQFVGVDAQRKNISLITDEEGNSEIILTPKSARWLAKKLVEILDAIEG